MSDCPAGSVWCCAHWGDFFLGGAVVFAGDCAHTLALLVKVCLLPGFRGTTESFTVERY